MDISINISINISALDLPSGEWIQLTDNQGNDITDNFNNPIYTR